MSVLRLVAETEGLGDESTGVAAEANNGSNVQRLNRIYDHILKLLLLRGAFFLSQVYLYILWINHHSRKSRLTRASSLMLL